MLHRRLELHLGLHFHRFLKTGALKIQVDQQEHGEQEHQIRSAIVALDPFAYPAEPTDDYPRTFAVRIAGVGEVAAEGHIWPPNSELPEYRLGNRAAARQGFYFYRNDRLIQAGGWNGLIQNEAEPHGSLARVRIDLPLSCDASFSLNVQKSSVIVPPGFVEAVQTAAEPDDVPLVKALVFCLLGSDLMTVKSSVKRRRELARINRILAAAAGLERG